MPEIRAQGVALATDTALKAAMRVALRSLDAPRRGKPRNRLHQAAAAATGALGGAFGIAATAVELPVSTTILLRSIAEIARENGEDIAEPRDGARLPQRAGVRRRTPVGRDSAAAAITQPASSSPAASPTSISCC